MRNDDYKSLFHVCEIEITYRNPTPYHTRVHIDRPWKAYDVLLDSWDTGKIELVEQFKILLLDNKCNCLGISEISSGGMNACLVDPKIVFATALKAKATRLILAHNHPTGVLKPSEADILLTRRMVQAGQLLDLPVLDHVIVTPDGYYSFSDHGLIPGWDHSADSHGPFSSWNGPS